MERNATFPVPDGDSDPAQVKKRKSLEQKIDFVKKKCEESAEQDIDSDKEKKS